MDPKRNHPSKTYANKQSINQSINSLSHNSLSRLSSPFSINESINQSSAIDRHNQVNSSSLYTFSNIHPQPLRSANLSLDEDLYRGIDLSSSMFQTPAHALSNNARNVSFADFDMSFSRQMKLNEPAQSNLIKKELSLHPIGAVSSLSSLSALASLESVPSPSLLKLQTAPSFVELYTSFYSRSSAQSLVDCISSFFVSRSIDFEFNRNKTKFCVSFLCPVFTSLSVAFNVRLYTSTTCDMLICEIQRRDGCVMAFNYVYTHLVNHIKKSNMFVMAFTACPLSSLPGSTPHSVADVAMFDMPMQLDDQSFNLLVSLVNGGDSVQQSDAIRLIGQCLNSSGASMTSRLPAVTEVIRTTLINQANSQGGLHEEKITQVTHLMSMLICSSSRKCSLDRRIAVGLMSPMINLLALLLADITLTKLKIVRFIMETVNSLTQDHESLGTVKHTLNERDVAVLHQCCLVKDIEVSRLASTVSKRLSAM